MSPRKKVAPLRVTGSPSESRPRTPVPQLSIVMASLRSKIPLGKVRRNLDRIAAWTNEYPDGVPSGPELTGFWYQPETVNHWRGAMRPPTVSHWVGPDGAIESSWA